MPTLLFDSHELLPLPSLKAYITVSFLLISCSIYYAFQVTSEPDWNNTSLLNFQHASSQLAEDLKELQAQLTASEDYQTSSISSDALKWATKDALLMRSMLDNPYLSRFIDIMDLMFHEPLCMWTLINTAFCFLIIVGKMIQKVVFGELRVSEQQHIKDKFWNFVFYKFMFIFGVMNVYYMDEVVLWCSWFSLLGFLSLLAQLCKDRFVYLSFSTTTPKWTHIRLLFLLLTILASSNALLLVGLFVGFHAGLSTFAIMAAECLLVSVRTLYVFVRYAIHLWDLRRNGVWENRAFYVYYTELVFEMIALVIDFLHYLQMLFCGSMFLSMASLVIIMQLRYLFTEICRKYRKHCNYLQVVRLMEKNFAMATASELETNSDDCAICWDRMDSARKLPCGHLFHTFCLRSWLEQDTSCPTCRKSLKERNERSERNERDDRRARDDPASDPDVQGQGPIRNHFYHFDGSRYASWLPTVSVEVTRLNLNFGLLSRNAVDPNNQGANSQQVDNSLPQAQLDAMVRQVIEWFPDFPVEIAQEDLRITRSVNETVENILDGRLAASSTPQVLEQSDESESEVEEVTLRRREPHIQNSEMQSNEQIQEENAPIKNSFLETVSEPTTSVKENEEEEVECPASKIYGDAFGSNSSERENSFSKRKELLYEIARKKFLAKHKKNEAKSN